MSFAPLLGKIGHLRVNEYTPLADRKSRLAKLLQRRPEGIHAAPFGPELFPHACLMGLEGIVSKLGTGLLRRALHPLAQDQEPEPSGLSPCARSLPPLSAASAIRGFTAK